MARIRTIKPEFWTDGDVMDLSPWARLLFIGSWNFSMCDFGHVADDPRRLKMQVLPADDVDGAALVDEIVASGRMTRIDVDGRSFLHIKRFTDHQKTEKRWTPRCPVCKANEPPETSPNHAEPPTTSAPERKGQERKGRAAELKSVSDPKPRTIPDDGLTRIQTALNNSPRTHARKTADWILAKAPNDVRNPVAYVVAAIKENPDAYRYRRGNPKKGQECRTHAGEWGDNCRACVIDARLEGRA